MILNAALLALLLGWIGWQLTRRRPAPPPDDRHRQWTLRAWWRWAMPAAIVLLLLGRVEALWTLPAEFGPLVAQLGSAPGEPWLLASYAGGVAGGMVGADLVAVLRRRRPRWLPDYRLLEAPPGAGGWATALALTAGLTEEPLFRLVLPLLLIGIGLDAPAAFAVAAVLFGLAHRYQGWKGILLTTFSAAAFTCAYIQTASLWFVILLHAAIDWNLIVLQPLLVRRFGRRASS